MHRPPHSLGGRKRPSTGLCSESQITTQMVKEPLVLEPEAPNFVLGDTLKLRRTITYMAGDLLQYFLP